MSNKIQVNDSNDNNNDNDLNLLLPKDFYYLFLQVAMMGLELHEWDLSNRITQSLIEIRPDLPEAHTVWALSEQFSGNQAHALRILEEALQQFPESQRIRALLGGCMKVLDRPGWRTMINAVIADGGDRDAVALACSLLQIPNTQSEQTAQGGVSVALPPGAMWA